MTLKLVSIEEARKNFNPLQLEPVLIDASARDAEFEHYVGWIQNIIKGVLPSSLLDRFSKATHVDKLAPLFEELVEQIPILHPVVPESTPGTLKIRLLAHSNYMQGIGRFFCDSTSRWLIPGKPLDIISASSINFRFSHDPSRNYYFQQLIFSIDQEKDLKIIKSHLSPFLKELRMIISTSRYLRKLVSKHAMSTEQKVLLVQNHVSKLIDQPQVEPSLFDQIHHFLVQASVEVKVKQIQEHVISASHQRPITFDDSLFSEMRHLMLLFREEFTRVHSSTHLIRLMTSFHLFKLALRKQMRSQLQHRHVMIKLLRTKLENSKARPIVGILVGMNILSDHEMFNQKHLLEAIQRCVPSVKPVEGSYLIDRRDVDRLRLFYIEVEKEDHRLLKKEEIKKIKLRLPQELRSGIEKVSHTVFMPRNDEEVMRSILLLSHELKYVRDIPQVVINFDRQTEDKLLFTVVLVRILQSPDVSLEELFSHYKTPLRFQDFDVKPIGRLRKKYDKEANVFTVSIDKKQFMRKDFSIDLFKARQFVSTEIGRILGDIRDFNGGILSKQNELYHELRQLLTDGEPLNEFLLENFFYSINPPLMQSILPASLLKTLYLMLQEGIEHAFKKHLFFLKSHWEPEYLLILAAAPRASMQEALDKAIQQLKIPPSDLCSTAAKGYDIWSVGYIYHCEDVQKCTALYNAVEQTLIQWENEQPLRPLSI